VLQLMMTLTQPLGKRTVGSVEVGSDKNNNKKNGGKSSLESHVPTNSED
jgi:hypothetical protein